VGAPHKNMCDVFLSRTKQFCECVELRVCVCGSPSVVSFQGIFYSFIRELRRLGWKLQPT
jgi:hypothetical protein